MERCRGLQLSSKIIADLQYSLIFGVGSRLLKPDDVHGGRRREHSGLRQVLDPQRDDSVAVFVFADVDIAHCRRVDLRRSEVVSFGPACQGSEHQYGKRHQGRP